MNTLATLALIFTPSALFVDPPQPTDGSIMDTVVERYNTGNEVNFSSLIGWWTGRCYLPESPNKPFGISAVAHERSENEGADNGPEFPPIVKMVKRMAFLGQTITAPNYWDELDEAKVKKLQDFENSDEFKPLIAVTANGNLYTDNVVANLRYNLKKNSDYFYGTATLLNDSGDQKAGSVFAGCYFFKKLN